MPRKVVTLRSDTRRLAAQTVRQAREAAGLTQEATALRYRVGVRTLRDIEAGKARMTALELVIDLQNFGKERRSDEAFGAKPLALPLSAEPSRLPSQQVAGGAASSVVPAAATGRFADEALAAEHLIPNQGGAGSSPAVRAPQQRHGAQGDPATPLGTDGHETALLRPFFSPSGVAVLLAPHSAPARACTENTHIERQCSALCGVTVEGEAPEGVARRAA